MSSSDFLWINALAIESSQKLEHFVDGLGCHQAVEADDLCLAVAERQGDKSIRRFERDPPLVINPDEYTFIRVPFDHNVLFAQPKAGSLLQISSSRGTTTSIESCQ